MQRSERFGGGVGRGGGVRGGGGWVSFCGLGAALLLAGCASKSDGFLRAKAAGDRAGSAGRLDEAAAAYRRAAEATTKPHDQEQGYFLEASTLERAGRIPEAMKAYEELGTRFPSGDHTARAAFERARLEIDHGDRAKGEAMLEAALFRYPASGPSREALRKVIRIHETNAPGSGLAFTDKAMAALGKSELAEDIGYRKAELLRDAGRDVEARDAFIRNAQAFPYPGGTLTDDAWFHAAELSEKLGDGPAAIACLQALLAPREPSSLGQGSYERPRYSQAQFHLAEVYRDKLRDSAAARREFRKLVDKFPTSTLRDDALFQEALLAKRAGDDGETCEAARKLTRDFPESRYAGCADRLCASVAPSSKAPRCRAYVEEQITGKKPADAAPEAPAE
jgi:tetratricopeptide (TPR) repeat protein